MLAFSWITLRMQGAETTQSSGDDLYCERDLQGEPSTAPRICSAMSTAARDPANNAASS
jgi:hypothetical protein